MVHNAVNNDVVRHRHVVARIVEQVGAGGIIQGVRIGRTAVAAHELPNHRLCRQLRAVGMDTIKIIVAAVAVGERQRHSVPLIPAQAAPTGGGVAQITAGRANGRLHAIGRHRYARIVSGKVFQLCAGKRAPLRHRRFVLVIAVFVAAADGARDRGGVGGHDGQPHDSHQ